MDDFLVILKRECVLTGTMPGQVIERIKSHVKCIVRSQYVYDVSEEMVKEHYADLKESDHFEGAVSQLFPGPLIVMKCYGDLEGMRKACGATDPKKAEPGTIRADFAKDISANVIHCSKNKEEAERELKIWF